MGFVFRRVDLVRLCRTLRWLQRSVIPAGMLLLSGCMIVPRPTVEELQRLDSPPAEIKAKIDLFMPRVLAWYESVEADGLMKGRSLSSAEVVTARAMGVADPSKVRILVTEDFPLPESDDALLKEAKRYGLGSTMEGGRTMGYLILLKPRHAENATIVRHELVHVGQHDRLGREAFLRRYLTEMEMMGYSRSPLELEAYARQGTNGQ